MSEQQVTDINFVEVVAPTLVNEALPTVPEMPAPEPLTLEEDNFALAMVEYSGNIGMAYRAVFGDEAEYPVAKGRELLNKANVALRVKTLIESSQEGVLVSAASHLHELAVIRDLAKLTGQIKVAYSAERSRGEAAGIYAKHNGGGKAPTTAVQVVVNNKYDRDI